MVAAGNALRFFELEWIALDDARAEELLADERLAADRHHLAAERRYRPHRLSEPEERMLAEREPVVQAWSSLFDQTVANVRTTFDDGRRASARTRSRSCSRTCTGPQRELRLRALDTLYAALEPQTPVLASCYDAIVADRLVQDRLRAYPDPARRAPPLERARAGRGRRDDGGDRGALRHRAALVPAQGGAARPRAPPPRRPVRAARRGPRRLVRRVAGPSCATPSAASRPRCATSARRSSRSAASTPSRGRASAAARSARASPRTPPRTCS
ncbi:MAG: hypothetical protein V9F04_14850 [Dermatophilaceae bacterium]